MTNADALFELGRQSLHALIDELAADEVYVDPALELRQGEGILSYYNLHDAHIYLSVPDPGKPRGKFALLLVRFATNLDSTEEVMRLLELLIPWLVAHETGHHLRHKYGLLGPDGWREEWIASKLATQFVKRRLTPSEKKWLLDHLGRIAAALEPLLYGGRSPVVQAEATTFSIHDPIRYLLTHMRWLHRDLLAQNEVTLGEFVALQFASQSAP